MSMDSLVKPGNDSVGSGHGLINQTATFSPVLSFIFPYALRPTPYALRSTPYALLTTPYALRSTPYALRLTLYALRLTLYFLSS